MLQRTLKGPSPSDCALERRWTFVSPTAIKCSSSSNSAPRRLRPGAGRAHRSRVGRAAAAAAAATEAQAAGDAGAPPLTTAAAVDDTRPSSSGRHEGEAFWAAPNNNRRRSGPGAALRRHAQRAAADAPADPQLQGAGACAPLSMRISRARTLPQLLEVIRTEGPRFSPEDTSQALHRLAGLRRAAVRSPRPDAAAAADAATPVALGMLRDLLLLSGHAAALDAWGVALALWSCGVLGAPDPHLLSALCARGAAALPAFSPIDCASALVGWGWLRVRSREQREFVDALLQRSLDSIQADPSAWRPRELTNAAWALARIGAAGPGRQALLEALAAAVEWRLDDFSVQELATLVYAFAKLHHRAPSALRRIANKVARHLDLLGPQDAAMLMWGFARLAFKPGPLLLDRLPLAVAPRLWEFKPQEVTNLLYAYGTLRHRHPALMDAVAAAAAPRLSTYSTQDLVLTLWAYGAVRHTPADPALLHAACGELLARRRRLLPAQAVAAIKAFAKCGFQPPAAFMSEFAAHVVERLPSFKPTELCHLLWAYARLGYRDVALVEASVGAAVAALQARAVPPLPRITVDTLVWCAARVGFWPQALIDAAEARGVYGGNGGDGDWDEGGFGSPAWAAPRCAEGSSSDSSGSSMGEEEVGGSGSWDEADSGSGGISFGGGSDSGGNGYHIASPELEAAAAATAAVTVAAQAAEWPAVAASKAGPRMRLHRHRPAPVPLSLHQWQHRAQLAAHRTRQQAHGTMGVAVVPPPAAATAEGGPWQQRAGASVVGLPSLQRQRHNGHHHSHQHAGPSQQQQQQQQGSDPLQQQQPAAPPGAWVPPRGVLQLLECPDFGEEDDLQTLQPRDPAAALEPLGTSRR